MVKKLILAFCLLSLLILPSFSEAQEKRPFSTKMDLMFVLDNSGSMRKNDPNFLVKKTLDSFLKSFSGDIKLGIVIFAERAELVLPLTSVSQQGVSEKIEETLKRLDYRGRYTDIPAGIERAIYELKKGREDAKKVIVFMTDGLIDTGNKERDKEKTLWLKQELLTEANRNNIRIFAIAFTEEADYALIQTIAQRTEGNYYRALKPEDVTEVLNSIYRDITKAMVVEKPAEVKPSTSLFNWVLVGFGVVGAILVVIVLVVFMKKKEVKKPPKDDLIPERILYSEDERIGKLNYKITKKEITIGRAPGVDILIDDNRVSKIHARIVYENGNFYLIDQDSTNGTWVKRKRITPREKILISHGDEIFLVNNQTEKDEPDIRKRGYRFIFVDPAICQPEIVYKVSEETTAIFSSPKEDYKRSEKKEIYEEKQEDKDKTLPFPQTPLTEPRGKDKDETLPYEEKKPQEVKEQMEESTIVKEGWCKVHPARKNIGYCHICHKQGCELCIHLCTVCGRTFCAEHIRERDGRKICNQCFSKI